MCHHNQTHWLPADSTRLLYMFTAWMTLTLADYTSTTQGYLKASHFSATISHRI